MSSVRHGPVSPSVNDTRPDATESVPEVPEYTVSVPVLPASPASLPAKAPPTPRKKPIGISMSDARQLDAHSVEVVVSRTTIICGFMPDDSILEIPKAVGSDENTVKDPYVADGWEAPCIFYQREIGTAEFATRARVTRWFNLDFFERDPGKMNENRPDSDTAIFHVAEGVVPS